MKPTAFGIVAGILIAVLGASLSACGDEPRGACLYGVTDGLVCYTNVSASCCEKIYGEFHEGDSCSKYPTAKPRSVITSGAGCY